MNGNEDYDALAELLPFYVNGTLDEAECARIDAALAASPALRGELELLSGLARVVKTGGREMTQNREEETGRSEARLEAVLGQLENKVPAPEVAVPAKPQGLGAMLGFLNPSRWHPAVSLTLAALAIGQGLAISNFQSGKAQNLSQIASLQKRVGDLEFELASGPDGQKQGNLMIELKPDAPWAAVEALLGKEGLSIVSGPSDSAVTLSSAAKGEALDAQLKRLRASPLIASADKAA